MDYLEVIGPGVAGECQQKCGMHIAEDAFIAEIIDPETGAVLPPGSVGELVLTSPDQRSLSHDPLQNPRHYQSVYEPPGLWQDPGPDEKRLWAAAMIC